MSARFAQNLIAAVFLGLGAWCLVFPASIVALAFRPAFRSDAPLVPILVACFGAQAMLVGLLAATARFTRQSFLVLGLALLPFLVFDWYFYWVVPLLTPFGMLDLLGNLAMLALCWQGWRGAAA